jgi:hypothetical protein
MITANMKTGIRHGTYVRNVVSGDEGIVVSGPQSGFVAPMQRYGVQLLGVESVCTPRPQWSRWLIEVAVC